MKFKKVLITLALGLTISLGFSSITKAAVSDNVTSLATVWEKIEALENSITGTINNVLGGAGSDLTTTQKQVIPAINELDGELGNLSDLTTTKQDSIVNSINEHDKEIGDISNLQTDDKTNIVSAINSLKTFADSNNNNLSDKIGDLNTLTTANKNTVVAAINEVDNHADTANKNAGTWIDGPTINSGTTTKNITVAGMKGNDSIVEVYYDNNSVNLLKNKHIDVSYSQSGTNLTITFSKAIPSNITIDKIRLINP